MYRNRKTYKQLKKVKGAAQCALCHNLSDHAIIEETAHFSVVENKFPYNIWEHRNVLEHLMIVPKLHKKGLAEFRKKRGMPF